MKTVLPERSLHIRARLNFIVQQMLDVAQDELSKIVLTKGMQNFII
ncbi:MAG TPA: nucleotidyltransferase [Rickettsia endosymbiont of Pyrocoelia pectoralis]|nr:nucleotidyltransferase [Rickettsia endosymbiont of Pyrocoelia pectoralis]